MENTGRLRSHLDSRVRNILFGTTVDQALEQDLEFYIQIDRAHLVMLVENKLLPLEYGRRLLETIARLSEQNYAPLRGVHAPRGLYLLYEQWLIDALGLEIGGALHMARSRNDLNATVLRLRLRRPFQRLIREVLRLIAILIRRAERYAGVTMPLYTHYQPALPITYGHYLSGVGLALSRDLRQIQDAVEPDRCPLGAGAGGGACIGINTARTAQLLGFTDSVLHSVEAVASRDLVLRLLSALAILGVTLSRAATDLLLWTTEEFKLVEFPDNLAGSSSMLPQKRNPFLLEHIKGRSAACLGAFTSAAVGMHATPFSNSVAVGTEAVKPIWTALNEMTEAVLMLRLVIAGTRPCSERMQVRAEKGLTAATELANTLVEKSGLSFRQAHKRVGQLVSALDARESLPDAAQRLFLGSGVKLDPETLDPARVAERAEFGGGPGSGSAARILDHLTRDWTHSLARLSSQRARWSHGSKELELAVFHISREQFAFTSR